MPDYSFHSLSDADFEDLACDLLRASLGISLQAFTKGRDFGIDLLHGARVFGSDVVQCKHYWRSGFSKLKSVISKEEAPKFARNKPKRLILATSVGLTPANKEELLDILTPYCHGINDIYGREDLNTLLRANPGVETAHYKLWLTSVPVLQRVLRYGATIWNSMNKEDIERKMSLYVQTEAYGAAMEILTKHNYCVLSGIPGIGKTTLAQVLVTRLMEDGYELIAVRDDIREAFEGLDLSKKQVVYYDDFLGQSSIAERLGKNEDQGIARLLSEARRTGQLKVILTTREYILEDAKRIYEPLNRANLDVAKCIVKVEDYTRGHRARILYNHVYFSGLPYEYAVALLKDKGYRRIIDHKGYSPRIVEWMTLGRGACGAPSEEYVARFVHVLDDPAQLWQHAFDNQISEDARAILYCLGSIEGWLGLDELRAIWANLRGISTLDSVSIESKRIFKTAMKQLEGSFTRTTRVQPETAVEFHNPSIKDYVRRRIVEDADVRLLLLRSALHFEQVSCLVSLARDGKVAKKPSGLIPDDGILHDAIRRTFDAKPATYQMVRYGADEELRLCRISADMGARLTLAAEWARSYGPTNLLPLCCDIAADMVSAGEGADLATLASCSFLEAVIKHFRDGEQNARLIQPFLAHMDEHLSKSPSASDWQAWTTFVKSNNGIFDDNAMDDWADRAETFCREEIDVLIENADTSSELQQWYDMVVEVAQEWNLPLDGQSTRFEERLEELQAREDRPDSDDDRRGPRSVDRMTSGDAEIDRLFDSLQDRVDD